MYKGSFTFLPADKDKVYDPSKNPYHNCHATSGNKRTSNTCVLDPHTQNPHNPSLSRFEVFSNGQSFCGKPQPLY